MQIKSRVVTYYQLVVKASNSTLLFNSEYFCSGTIAELPAERNLFRYLIIFDNGYVSYAKPSHVFPIFDLFHVPIDRLHIDHINFLFNYFNSYPERSMVAFGRNVNEQEVNTFFFGRWFPARVIDVDCSLVKLEIENRLPNMINGNPKVGKSYIFSFQLYRGSFKLYPLYENFLKSLIRHKEMTEKETHRKHKALTEFELYVKSKCEKTFTYDNKSRYLSLFTSTQFPEYDAKSQPVKELMVELVENFESSERNEPPKLIQGVTKYLDLDMYYTETKYKQHACTRTCTAYKERNIDSVKYINPLLMPILHGWQRLVCNQRKTLKLGPKKWIVYMAPCGKTLRNTADVERYLHLTDSKLVLDQFSFDPYVHVNREYEANAKYLKIEDITDKSEMVPISCVNCMDSSEPDKIFYSATRKPLEGVPLNTTEDELQGCDCTDNCRDRTKCSCWLKTAEATLFTSDTISTEVGYKGRRLPKMVSTGIFECNSKCKCDCRCLNKVVQNGISVRLQLFKTTQKGWGLRCLDDIPKGAFICTYAGLLMTEEQSDIRGAQYGDEYFAELG